MPVLDITTGVQAVSAAGAVTGSLDTSALTGDWTVRLQVLGLASGKKARIAIEDTANASAFSEAQQIAVFDVTGPITAGVNDLTFNLRKYQSGETRFGAANNKLRVNVLAADASPVLSLYSALVQ